jgi:hypothetical protein
VSITVRLQPASGRTVSVAYATSDGSATAPADYAAVSGRLVFAPGETTHTIDTTIQGDEIVEGDNTFKVGLSDPANATIADGSATVTIHDDDVGLGRIGLPATINASKLFCASAKRCPGLPVQWTVLTRGKLVFELSALAPRPATKTKPAGVKVFSILQTASTISRARTARKLLRPTPGRGARQLLRRLRSANAGTLRLAVTFTNRGGEAETTTQRVQLNLRR